LTWWHLNTPFPCDLWRMGQLHCSRHEVKGKSKVVPVLN
jgi:hypothetical protein